MKLLVLAIGRTGRMLEAAVADYQERAQRYWPLQVVEVREERSTRHASEAAVRDAEGERLLKLVPNGYESIALTRTGDAFSSKRLARHVERTALHAGRGIAFLIGGAFGLSDEVLREASRRMRLSTFTMPHDLARLVLLEQLYRAGTIVRGEPYHKGGDES